MRRSMWIRVLAIVLVIAMVAAPVSAATAKGQSDLGANSVIGGIINLIRHIIRDILDGWFGPGDEEPVPTTPTEPVEPTAPTTPVEPTAPTEPVETEPGTTEPGETTAPTVPGETEPEETEPEEETPKVELNLIEGHKTSQNGQLLRGVTYSLNPLAPNKPQSVTAPYAVRPMGNALSTSTLRGIQTMAATQTTVSETPLEITTDDLGPVIPDGKYVIKYNHATYGRYMTNNTKSGSPWGTIVLLGTYDKSAATPFTFTRQADGTYTIQGPAGNYMNIERNIGNIVTEANYFSVEIKDDGIWLRDTNSNDCINVLGANEYEGEYFGGWSSGSPLELYAVTTTTVAPEEPEQPDSAAELVYFPVTMFNYDQDTINGFTDDMDDDWTVREGFYFSNGGSELNATTSEETSLKSFVDGKYVLQNYIAKDNGIASWLAYVLDVSDGKQIRSYAQDAATVWTLTNLDNGNVTLTTVNGDTTYYLTFGSETSAVTTDYTELKLVSYPHTTAGVRITKGDYYLGHSSENTYCGNTDADSTSNGFGFFRVADDSTISSSATEVTTVKTVVSGYERWNWWSYLSGSNSAQNKFYAGLVEDQLDKNNKIVFTVNEPGIFTFDKDHPEITNDGMKDIYQHVGLPFVKDADGFYTFDSDAHGTYFADTTGDGNSDPWYGASDDYFNMFFDYQNTQGWADKSDPNSNLGYGDKSKNLWAPYNTNANDTAAGAIDYHFGMRADIPFSMTSNGCIKSTDDNSEHITFTFAGDDDVWIFIDGHLVIDLGGIHNRIGATIDFADNTITYFRPESNAQTLPIGSFNTPEKYPLNEDGTITVKLYNDANGEGALGQTRPDFSSKEEHIMSIFYLERGEGTSNCKIRFNLPMRDTVLITKDASKSWSAKQDERDGENGDGTANLTPKEQAAVDKLNFGFTLYKKAANETEFTAVKNTNFYVQDGEGNVQEIRSTDSNGKFYLKNGQTAKFMTDMPMEGVTYYVVEDAVPEGFLTPDYLYGGKTTHSMIWHDSTLENPVYTKVANGNLIPEHELPLDATENKSYVIEAKGSIEAIDSVEFICTNYLNAELPNPTALAYEDIIVIDYGLPVHVDPLANDLFRGNEIEIVAWGDESLTLHESLDEYGNAIDEQTTWTGTQNFRFGTVKFNEETYTETQTTNKDGEVITTYTRDTFDYTLTEQLTEVEVISYIVRVESTLDVMVDGKPTGETRKASRYALAKVYIVPATIMYYEEDFTDLIKFTFNNGAAAPTVKENVAFRDDYQEPGVVGDNSNHTYGTDNAYLKDSEDSNGTSYFFDTTNGWVRFQYTFTGTGTSFFARTSAKTGYMQVLVFEGDTVGASGEQIDTYYRDTYYNDTNGYAEDADGTLYNIPVYTNEDLKYGTYTVLVTVAKKGTKGAGAVDENGTALGSGNEFYLDGIRIMQPLNEVILTQPALDEEGNPILDDYGNPIMEEIYDEDGYPVYDAMTTKARAAYATDGESNLDVVTLRQKLINDNYTIPEEGEDGELPEEKIWPFVVLTDTNGDIIYASDYVSFGPKEEVYLAPGQTVSFSLKYWQNEGLKLYMGMKAPFGRATVNVGHESYLLQNATDSYYDVTDNNASIVTMYEQACNDEGYLLFTDSNGDEVYMDDAGEYIYTVSGEAVAEDAVLTPVDDLNFPFTVVTYTFEATDSIVSLTNIKVVGSYEFFIVEDENIEMP